MNVSVKLGVSIGVHETIGDLRTMLSNDTGIERGQILLAEIDDLTSGISSAQWSKMKVRSIKITFVFM